MAFADSEETNHQSGSGNDQEHQSEDNNQPSNQEDNQTRSEHHSEGDMQSNQESNQTQAANQVTNERQNRPEHEEENANSTEHQAKSEQKSSGETENEDNALNATHYASEKDMSDIAEAKTNETIAAQVDSKDGNVDEKSIDNNVILNVENNTGDIVNMTVSASSQSGPKVILVNLNSTAIDVGNIKYLHIMYDNQSISAAASLSDVLHPASSDPPHFA